MATGCIVHVMHKASSVYCSRSVPAHRKVNEDQSVLSFPKLLSGIRSRRHNMNLSTEPPGQSDPTSHLEIDYFPLTEGVSFGELNERGSLCLFCHHKVCSQGLWYGPLLRAHLWLIHDLSLIEKERKRGGNLLLECKLQKAIWSTFAKNGTFYSIS